MNPSITYRSRDFGAADRRISYDSGNQNIILRVNNTEYVLLDNVDSFTLRVDADNNLDGSLDGSNEVSAIRIDFKIRMSALISTPESIREISSPKRGSDRAARKTKSMPASMEQTPMFDNFILSRLKYALQSVRAGLSGEKGNILVYVVIVMVIFAVLGAAHGFAFQHLHRQFGYRQRITARFLSGRSRSPLWVERIAPKGFLHFKYRHTQ